MIKLSKSAREKYLWFLGNSGYTLETASLRVQILPGGCNGFSYSFCVEPNTKQQEDDMCYDLPDGIKVVIDPFSGQYLEGTLIDYRETMQQAGFSFDNPNATGACGCGESFSAERKDHATI